MGKIKKISEGFDALKIEPIHFKSLKGEDRTVYPCVMIDFMKTDFQTRDAVRKDMDELMSNQGFQTLPQFVDANGYRIRDNASVIEIKDKYPGFKFVFFVEEKNLAKAKEIAEKHGVDFYRN